MDAEPLAVVDGVIHGMELQFAGITGAGIHRADGQAPMETPPYGLFQFLPDFFYLFLNPGWERFCDDTGSKYLMQDF